MGVGDALDDFVDVVFLFLGGDAVLVDNQMRSLGEGFVDDVADLLVVEGVVDGLFAALVAVVGRCGVARVDGEEFALDVGDEVVDPLDAFDVGVFLVGLPGGLVDDPFEEGFDLDVEAGVGVLQRDDAVDGGIGETGTLVVVGEALGFGVLGVFDMACEGVGCADSIFAGDDGEGSVGGASVDALGDDWGNKFEDVRANSAGYLICLC